MLFEKSYTILYLKRQSLELWSASKHMSDLTFIQDTVKNLEIINQKKFEISLLQLILSSKLEEQETILALSDDVLFSKTLLKEQATKDAIETFFSRIPFEPKNIATSIVYTDNQVILYAANQNVLDAIKHTVLRAGWKVSTVIPLQMFSDIDTKTGLTIEEVEKIIKQVRKVKSSFF